MSAKKEVSIWQAFAKAYAKNAGPSKKKRLSESI
jgi:hypothetical protein